MKVDQFVNKAFRKSIQLVFGFDKWHISPLQERPYAIDIIAYCNKRSQRDTFAEIGCGLGDIIRNVSYDRRIGFDNDKKVLTAAAFLPSGNGKVEYAIFNFPESKLEGTYDVLAMVNWIHHIEPAILQNKIADYLTNNITINGEIIIDTVQDPEYRFNHDINFLAKQPGYPITKIGNYTRQREVWAIKKLN